MMSLTHFLSLMLRLSALLSLGHSTPIDRDFAGPNLAKFAVGHLPNVTFNLPASWAGQISIPGSEDDNLFFWLFQAESPSDTLIIWLNGGPGCSSLTGLSQESGPLHFPRTKSTPWPNSYSWTKLANILYIDQPVGTGFSSGGSPPTNNLEITHNFYQWLTAFYKEFPALKSKNTILAGESYAAIYIPYFTQAILAGKKTLNINLTSIVIGDGNFGNVAAATDVTINAYMQEQKDTFKLPQDIASAFDHASQKCGFDQVVKQVTYPVRDKIKIPGNPEQNNYKRQSNCFKGHVDTPANIQESVDAVCYGGCAIGPTAFQYLMKKKRCFNIYNVDYGCEDTVPTAEFEAYFNQPSVQHAIHASPTKFGACNGSLLALLPEESVPPPAYSIMPAILDAGVSIHLYSGDRDFLFNHIGTELMIQNMTWCGKQGFESPPNHLFRVDGKVAGNWGAERGLSYHRILRAGHFMPYDYPSAGFAYMRDFVIGHEGYIKEKNPKA